MSAPVQDFLETILAAKKHRSFSPGELDDIVRRASATPAPRDVVASLRSQGRIALIAETKKASPSKGLLCERYDPGALARRYEEGGAFAVSVLTEERFFLGDPSHLSQVRAEVSIPVLRKDFLLHEGELWESRLMGADMALLIAAALPGERLGALRAEAARAGLTALVEVHDGDELTRALAVSPDLLGINNRDLTTFTTDIETTFRLLKRIPPAIPVVSESGITTREDVRRLEAAGVAAVLVGESLMRAPSPAAKIRELLGSEEPRPSSERKQ